VAAGDTFYSIGLRFGLAWQEITRANNLGDNPSVVPGTWLIIPGLRRPPAVIPPGTKPPVTKPPTVKPPAGRPMIGITTPTQGSTIYARRTVVVTGMGSGLRSSKVVVRVKDPHGSTLAKRETTVDASAHWRVEFIGGLPVHAYKEKPSLYHRTF
jgi:LysM repeat protein